MFDPYANLRQIVRTPVQAVRSYELHAPQDTHYRIASCAEAQCVASRDGWAMGFDVRDPERARAARIIRDRSGRSFTIEEIRGESGRVERVVFTFPPGQTCFVTHRVQLDRPPIAIVRDGDFRGNPTGFRRELTLEDWVDDFADTQDKISTRLERS